MAYAVNGTYIYSSGFIYLFFLNLNILDLYIFPYTRWLMPSMEHIYIVLDLFIYSL